MTAIRAPARFVRQDVVTVGVASALHSGAMTAASILGWRGPMPARDWLV